MIKVILPLTALFIYEAHSSATQRNIAPAAAGCLLLGNSCSHKTGTQDKFPQIWKPVVFGILPIYFAVRTQYDLGFRVIVVR